MWAISIHSHPGCKLRPMPPDRSCQLQAHFRQAQNLHCMKLMSDFSKRVCRGACAEW